MALDLPNLNPSLAGAFHDAFNQVTKDALERRKAQLANQYYGPEKELSLEQSRLANKYKPLEEAVKAQNAFSYGNNKMNNIGLYLRGISQMPAKERQQYLSNPANRANYNAMLEQFRLGMNNPQTGNILTSEFLNQFFPSSQQPGQAAPNAVANIPTQSQSNGNQVNNLLSQNIPPQQQQPDIMQQQTPSESQNIPITPSLNPQQREVLTAQMRTNNDAVSPQIKNRADNAIAFEKFLQLHRDKIGKVFKDAFKYNQIYGRGKNWLDKFKSEQPEEYQNFITAKNSLVPLMANGIRFLEAMGVSHEAQEDAKNQIAGAISALDISPETALKVFNNHMSALNDVTQGILDTAEPTYPGTRRKLAGIKEQKGDFIPEEPKYIRVKDKDGNTGRIPANQWKQAEKEGYKRI